MRVIRYTHACDASAAAFIRDTRLFAAASDEDCVLRLYDLENPGQPVSSFDVTAFLEPDDPRETEADIEGGAQLGNRIYWIGSHGRSKKGKERKIRQRLFATAIDRTPAGIVLTPAGKPYKTLLSDLSSSHNLAEFDLAEAAGKAPEVTGGFNIEGLAATPDGQLLIGFRNPIPGGRALIVRLANAAALVDGTANHAELSPAGLLDLDGRGVRALEFLPSRETYLLMAGAFDDSHDFLLYEWSGSRESPARALAVPMRDLKPEEIIALEQADGGLALYLLSDDGTGECKEKQIEARSFRMAGTQLTL
jgi:hypothetical protein